MNSENMEKESIKLSLPVNAAYVSAARLTASSIANRIGFDIDEIEDIKAAVSEACTYIIKKLSQDKLLDYNINFHLFDKTLQIDIKIDSTLDLVEKDNEMSIMMIKALMDEISVDTVGNNATLIKMVKNHKRNIFN